jgi:uncharacterized protein
VATYVDTSAWIALHEPRDANHKRATQALNALMAGGEVLVVGWHTLVEFADGLARHYDQRHASAEIERLLSSPRVRVEPSDTVAAEAREMFSKRGNWNVDLSDCLSFALMHSKAIRRVFTYDRDFTKPAFELVG